MISWFVVASVLGFVAIPSNSDARTWHIQPDGTGDAPTIQAGIDSAASGDSILVAAGIYYENLDMSGKALLLKGVSGAEATVIDGGQRGRVLAMSGGVVEGFTLQRGLCDNCGGAGVMVVRPGPAVIRSCIIQNNIAGLTPESGGGGGIYLELVPGVVIENNIVRGNYGGDAGGGLFDFGSGSTSVVRGNTFIGNSTSHGGGGMVVGGLTVERNLVIDNETFSGGGGIHAEGSATIRNNTVVRNRTGGSAAGIFALGAIVSHNIVALNGPGAGVLFQGPVYPDCNDIWGNETDVVAWPGTGNGNFSSDPLFCNAQQQDFHLHSNSPCLPEQNPACGLIGAFSVGCGTTAVESRSWAFVKGLYR